MRRTQTPERSLRRRGGGSNESDGYRTGGTTEEDTGISDPGEDDAPDPAAAALSTEGGETLLTQMKLKKMTIRAVMGTTMMVFFAGVIYLGHVYICMLVFALQCFIFSELVGVRKKQAAERRLPLFRSLQWAWFLVAAFFTWSASICEFLENSPKFAPSWSTIAGLMLEKNMMVSFSMYTLLLIVSVLSLRKGLYKYQITQYTWTIVTICIVVFQTQAVTEQDLGGLPRQRSLPSPIKTILYELRALLPGTARLAWDGLANLDPGVLGYIGDVEICSAQVHALSLGLFASFAAPFGGFLSSAIKRAYGIKDFNNLIPGHGGLMDRMDCQFVMFLCTFVHLRTFCTSPVTVDMLLAFAARLSAPEQQELMVRLQGQVGLHAA
ncbi:unnamed protein product [Polarella glacialis]|uniref:phosphatidate cytidylyltransferase n=1 Tax=Polarella glacialis TaxID=89957 RepID=A0A813HH81_POLGL|nr:unnamed protein product [Polarella glacialis]